ncbi:hypothetical protein J7K27_04825 [Candidatus Bathyarchaeota archaeon]|nr:hypothetical protein [Candidatus Bathyarchaeota archaeon]
MGLYWARKKYGTKIDVKSSIRNLAASILAATTTFLVINFTAYADWIEFIIGTLTFAATYLFTAPAMSAINKNDINNLKTMFSELGALSELINIPLNFMENFKPNIKSSNTKML